MATAEEIAAFRLTIGESTSDTYTDEMLSDRIDAAESLNTLGASIWREKAAKYARLVDMQEGTSSRKLSQLQSQALLMATSLEGVSDGSGGVVAGHKTGTRAIERL